GRLGRRVWPHARGGERQGARPQQHRLLYVDGRRRRASRNRRGRNGRDRTAGGGSAASSARYSHHSPAPVGAGSECAVVPASGRRERLTELQGEVIREIV